jgi:DNA polymerase IV
LTLLHDAIHSSCWRCCYTNFHQLRDTTATAKEIRVRIFNETGLTASAGISYNKFLAKLTSTQRKPNGQFVITPEMGPDFIALLPVAKFHGVGPVTAAKMQRLGIQTGADLRTKSLGFLQQHFGKSAAWYLAIANGEDDRPVVADRRRKSSGSETTFARDLTAAEEIEAGVAAMADEVWAWCEKAHAFGRTVTVKVKFADFQIITRSRSFPSAIARHEMLRQASRSTGACGVADDQGNKAARRHGFEFRSGRRQ